MCAVVNIRTEDEKTSSVAYKMLLQVAWCVALVTDFTELKDDALKCFLL
jgi:hypothetical protein